MRGPRSRVGRRGARALSVALARGACAVALASASASAVGGCGPSSTDVFRVAADGVQGGAFLSVWGDPAGTDARAYIAGGYVGVEPPSAPGGMAGRLVAYRGSGRFETVCRTDEVLWWVTGVRDGSETVVYAAGEAGRVVRLRGGRCESLTIDGDYPDGRPTLWGIHAAAPNDVWFVGGSGGASGPRGVLLRYDGARFRQEPALPAAAARENLYKVAAVAGAAPQDLVVVGAGGVVIRRDGRTGAWTEVAPAGLRARDNRLFTVACAPDAPTCYAVGGAASGLILRGDAGGWRALGAIGGVDIASELRGLNGVYAPDARGAYVVGNDGFTAYTDGQRLVRPPVDRARTTLHGVGGVGGVVIAVGGELDVWTPAQRGTILVRGDPSATFTVDGQAFTPTGDPRAGDAQGAP